MIENRSNHDEQSETSRADLYREWLGVETPEPTYYELLGVPPLESDRAAIHQAGRKAKRALRTYQIGRFRRQALELLAEVGQAVSVLTNPEKKRIYDNELLRAWRTVLEGLYRKHCEGQPSEPATLEAWLVACRERGVPVARLTPAIVRFVRAQAEAWPPHGEHGLSLPDGFWCYRDAVVLGRCLETESLEQRVAAVKRVQKALVVSEGLARCVAEEVTSASSLFARLPLVRCTREDPEGAILRMGRRIRRLGGHISPRSKVLAAVASLVGRRPKDLQAILPRLEEPPVTLPVTRRIAVAAGKVRRRVREIRRRGGEWMRRRPQLLVGAALLVSLALLVLAILAVVEIRRPWGPPREVQPPAPSEPGEPAEAPPPSEIDTSPEPPEAPVGEPPSDTEGWEEFIRKYPAREPANAPESE